MILERLLDLLKVQSILKGGRLADTIFNVVEYICKVELWAGYREKVIVLILACLDILLYRAQSQGLKSRWSHLGNSQTMSGAELFDAYELYLEELSLPQIG